MALILVVDFDPSRWSIVKLFPDDEVEILLTEDVEEALLHRPAVILVKWAWQGLRFMAAFRELEFIPAHQPICIAYYAYDPDTRDRLQILEINAQRDEIERQGFGDVLPLPRTTAEGLNFREQVLGHLQHRSVPKGG